MNLTGQNDSRGEDERLRGGDIPRARRLQAVRRFIDKNLGRGDLAPVLVAQALGISVRQLHLLFEPTGQTFSRYLLQRRLERARHYLGSDPDRKVIDVAFACGIRSSTVFYRGFQQAFGMNPTEYRRSLDGTASIAQPQD